MKTNSPSSPVCYADQLEVSAPADPASSESVRRWRRLQRERLLSERINAGGKQRKQWQEMILPRLEQRLPTRPAMTIGFYWPFKGEVDCRRIVCELLQDGWTAALPAVVKRDAPLIFYRWTPSSKLVPGIWKIPVPAAEEVVQPDVLLIPLVGFDGGYYCLGYGGGCYDRTIAARSVRPLCIGIGYEQGRLPSIVPQTHDIPMDCILTESVTMERHQGTV